eukprot:CAMPEP_0184313802 /NCGR_PEP_ID=MMETSP1049-20130417/67878_1 /TAXON_ID=77928 /ORGANISM="Proteomonas sulcata, Strain CCMP704" /LENGTH=44 /DNA_ID= /DNA_START= /DNA_END= /DNA_ORIENTATION=
MRQPDKGSGNEWVRGQGAEGSRDYPKTLWAMGSRGSGAQGLRGS